MALIEIDGLPFLKMGGSFHGYVSHNQMVYIYIYQNVHISPHNHIHTTS